MPEPPPIPESVHIAIEPGRPVEADEGGRQLLLNYIAVRKRLKGENR